jgi:hypothetical protein
MRVVLFQRVEFVSAANVDAATDVHRDYAAESKLPVIVSSGVAGL